MGRAKTRWPSGCMPMNACTSPCFARRYFAAGLAGFVIFSPLATASNSSYLSRLTSENDWPFCKSSAYIKFSVCTTFICFNSSATFVCLSNRWYKMKHPPKQEIRSSTSSSLNTTGLRNSLLRDFTNFLSSPESSSVGENQGLVRTQICGFTTRKI